MKITHIIICNVNDNDSDCEVMYMELHYIPMTYMCVCVLIYDMHTNT